MHRIRIDTGSAQAGNQLVAELIVADAACHGDARTEPRRGNCLVGPLAAGSGEEVLPEYRLAGARQLLAARHKIHVQAADHQDRLHRWRHRSFSVDSSITSA